jgi:hypothetical protein
MTNYYYFWISKINQDKYIFSSPCLETNFHGRMISLLRDIDFLGKVNRKSKNVNLQLYQIDKNVGNSSVAKKVLWNQLNYQGENCLIEKIIEINFEIPESFENYSEPNIRIFTSSIGGFKKYQIIGSNWEFQLIDDGNDLKFCLPQYSF